jgi:CheY-like chemotaxis protein
MAEAGTPMNQERPLSILVVEDNPVNREVMVCYLEDLGHLVRTAVNGREALLQLGDGPCDVVLMDLEMPVMDGFEAARRIRRGEAGEDRSRVPIVAVTAHSLPEFRRRCLDAGMDSFAAKPVRLESLQQTIADLCPKPGQAGELDETAGLQNLRGRKELFEKVCAAFLLDIPQRRAALLQGRAAGDAQALAMQAHALKGSAGLLGAQRLEQAARRLEDQAASGLSVDDSLDGLLHSLLSLERTLEKRLRREP